MGIEDVSLLMILPSGSCAQSGTARQSAIENMHLGVLQIDHDLNLRPGKRYLEISVIPKASVRVADAHRRTAEHNLRASHLPDERIHSIIEARLALCATDTP